MRRTHKGHKRHQVKQSYKRCKSSVVAHEAWLGGSPRLSDTRLSVKWFAANRHNPPTFWEQFGLSVEQLAFMFNVVDDVVDGLRKSE